MAEYTEDFNRPNGTALTTFGWSVSGQLGMECQSSAVVPIGTSSTDGNRFDTQLDTQNFEVELTVSALGNQDSYTGPMASLPDTLGVYPDRFTGVYIRPNTRFDNFNCECYDGGVFNAGINITALGAPQTGARMRVVQVPGATDADCVWEFYVAQDGATFPGTPDARIVNDGSGNPNSGNTAYTDTTIPVTRYAGVYGRTAPGGAKTGDDWRAADLAPAGPTVSEVATGTPTDTELQGSQFRAQNGNGGTYWSRIFPGTVTPDHATIVAGTGAVGNLETGSLTSDDQTITANHTGLTAATAYTRAATVEDSGSQASTPTYANFSTLTAETAVRFTLRDIVTGAAIPAGRTVQVSLWADNSGAPSGAPDFSNVTVVTTDPAAGYNAEIVVSPTWAAGQAVTMLAREVIAGGTPPGANDNWSSGALLVAETVFV